jgi:hypothetical protein
MWHTIFFSSDSELQNIPEAAPKASPSFSVSEKLARYGSSALSGVEYLTLLVRKESVPLALTRHFGSLKALARASFQGPLTQSYDAGFGTPRQRLPLPPKAERLRTGFPVD